MVYKCRDSCRTPRKKINGDLTDFIVMRRKIPPFRAGDIRLKQGIQIDFLANLLSNTKDGELFRKGAFGKPFKNKVFLNRETDFLRTPQPWGVSRTKYILLMV